MNPTWKGQKWKETPATRRVHHALKLWIDGLSVSCGQTQPGQQANRTQPGQQAKQGVQREASPVVGVLDQGVVVGCSGGCDSLALVDSLLHEGIRVKAVIVDHGLQAESEAVAEATRSVCQRLGALAEVVSVDLGERGGCSADYSGNTESRAREARYAALGAASGGLPVLVAHTRDDQAEGVLLALARGSGTASIAGMEPAVSRHIVTEYGASWLGRPFLALAKDDVRTYCEDRGITPWEDPHNWDDRFTRSAIRQELLPVMRTILDAGISENLARTAEMAREDENFLTECARVRLADALLPREELPDGVAPGAGPAPLNAKKLVEYPMAVRRRVMKLWLSEVAGPLTHYHMTQIDRLVTNWHGQGGVAVPYPAREVDGNRNILEVTNNGLPQQKECGCELDVPEPPSAEPDLSLAACERKAPATSPASAHGRAHAKPHAHRTRLVVRRKKGVIFVDME